jgi:hypothetical protein
MLCDVSQTETLPEILLGVGGVKWFKRDEDGSAAAVLAEARNRMIGYGVVGGGPHSPVGFVPWLSMPACEATATNTGGDVNPCVVDVTEYEPLSPQAGVVTGGCALFCQVQMKGDTAVIKPTALNSTVCGGVGSGSLNWSTLPGVIAIWY